MRDKFQQFFGRAKDPQEKWRAAIASQHQEKAIKDLLQVQRQLLEDRIQYFQLYPAFLNDFLNYIERHSGAPWLPTAADLQQTEAMIFTLAGLPGQTNNELSLWQRFSAILDRHTQPGASSALMMRIYHHPTISPIIKSWCITRLVGYHALDQQHTSLYMHYLSDPRIPSTDKTQLIQFLSQSCTTRHNAAEPEIKRAAFIAGALAANQLEHVPGVSTTLGIAALQIEQAPAQALKYFQQALQVDVEDREARLGLLLAALQQQDYAEAVAAAMQWQRPLVSDIEALLHLVQVLHWLNGRDVTGAVPTTVQELDRHMQNIKDAPFSPALQPLINLALARLHILDGNPHEAIQLLEGTRPGAGHLHMYYYLAWAYTLTNNPHMVLRCLTAAEAWEGRWTIACLLLGLDQELAKQHRIIEQLVDNRPLPVPGAYVPAFGFRIAQVCLRVPAKMRWTIGAGLFEEDLEALRSKLGYALYTHNLLELDTLLAMPLFQRLPVADRQTWQALRLLEGSMQTQGQKLLEEIIEKYHYRRASVILAVHLLGQGRQQRGREMLRQLEPAGPRLNLLQAYEDLSAGRLTTTQQLLQNQDTHYEARAHYLLGNFYLQQAMDAQQRRDLALARKQSEGALTAFERTRRYQQLGYVLPSDHEIYEDYAHAIANDPGTTPGSTGSPRQGTDQQAAWETLLRQLFSERPALVAAACERLPGLLSQTQKRKDAFIITLSQRIAFCCKRAENSEQGEKMVHALRYLAESSELPEARMLHQIGVALLARLRYTQASDAQREQVYAQTIRQAFQQQQNFPLTLLLMTLHLQHNNVQAAVNVLKRTSTDDPFARYVQVCLTALFTAPQTLPDKPAATLLSPAQQQIIRLLDTLLQLASGDDEQRNQILLSTVQSNPTMLGAIIPQERLFFALYEHYRRTGKPLSEFFTAAAPLLGSIVNQNLLVNLPRRLVSAREFDQAIALWELLLQHVPEPPASLSADYVYFLEYQAVGAYKNGNYREAANYLRRVLTFHETHAQDGGGKIDVPALEAHCHKLEQHAALQRLVTYFGYDKPQYVPGRFNVFSDLFQDSFFFYQALLVDKDHTIAREWRLVQASHADSVKHLHALAIIYRELAEHHAQDDHVQLSHVLWLLLFRSYLFWDYFIQAVMGQKNLSELQTLRDELFSKVLDKVLEHTLDALTTAGKRAFTAQQYERARQYLHILSLYAQTITEEELYKITEQHGLVSNLPSNAKPILQINKIATRYLDRWREDVLQEGEKILNNAEAIQKLPEGIRKNYAESIAYLTSFARLGSPSTLLLYQCIEQALYWSDDIYVQRETRDKAARKEISDILDKVEPEVQQLSERCEQDRGNKFKPEIKTLADYYYYRAQSTTDHDQARSACDMALSWLPDHVGATRVKRDIEWDLFATCLEDVIEGVEQRKPRIAGVEKGFAYLEALEKIGFNHYELEKARALYIFYIALSYDILGSYAQAESRAKQALEIAREFSGNDLQIKASIAHYLQNLQQKLRPAGFYPQAQPAKTTFTYRPATSSSSTSQYSPQVKWHLEQARKDSAEKKYAIAAQQYERAIQLCANEKAQQDIKRELAIVLNTHGEKVLEAIRIDRRQGKPVGVRLAEARKLFKEALSNDPTLVSARRNLESIDREF